MNQDRCVSCKISRHKSQNVRFFRFPKHEKRCKQWVMACQLKRLLCVPAESMYKRYRLCSHHFKADDFTTPNMCRLKQSACPSKFDFCEKSIISKLKEDLKNKLSKSVKVSDCESSGEINDLPESENMADDLQVLRSENLQVFTPREKPDFIETDSEHRIPGCSDSDTVNNEASSNKFVVNEAVLLDVSMNESFYSPEQRRALTNCLSKSSDSQSNGSNLPESNHQFQKTIINLPESNHHLKENLKTESSVKALKKQWLDAEIKATTAKRDYYEMKRVMLTKLQNDLDFENSSHFHTSTAIRYIKAHLNKQELTSRIEIKRFKQPQEAKIVSNNSEIEHCEPKLEISNSNEM